MGTPGDYGSAAHKNTVRPVPAAALQVRVPTSVSRAGVMAVCDRIRRVEDRGENPVRRGETVSPRQWRNQEHTPVFMR